MSVPTLMRSAARNNECPRIRMSTIGFRVAQTLTEENDEFLTNGRWFGRLARR